MISMIPNGEEHEAKSKGRWCYYLVVKKLSTLLRGITCLNCLQSSRTKKQTSSCIKGYAQINIFVTL